MSNPITTRRFHTTKSWKETVLDLARVFELWGIEKGEWGVTQPEVGRRFAEVWYYLPYDPSRKSVSCLSQDDAPTNLRQCAMTLTELQRASVRGVGIRSGAEEMLALKAGPSLGGPSSVDARGADRAQPERRKSAFRGLKDACAVLGINPDTDEQDAIDMRRIKLARFHPDRDQTGNADAYKRVQEAWEFIRERKGWRETP